MSATERVFGLRRRSAGQSAVEAAIALPLLLLLVLGSTDIGRTFYYREAVADTARQVVRLAVARGHQSAADSVCLNSAGTATASVPAPVSSPIHDIVNEAALESSSDGTPAGSALSGGSVTVTWHCSGGAAITNGSATSTDPSNAGSDSVEVRVSYQVNLLTAFVSARAPAPHLSADVFGRMEY